MHIVCLECLRCSRQSDILEEQVQVSEMSRTCASRISDCLEHLGHSDTIAVVTRISLDFWDMPDTWT